MLNTTINKTILSITLMLPDLPLYTRLTFDIVFRAASLGRAKWIGSMLVTIGLDLAQP